MSKRRPEGLFLASPSTSGSRAFSSMEGPASPHARGDVSRTGPNAEVAARAPGALALSRLRWLSRNKAAEDWPVALALVHIIGGLGISFAFWVLTLFVEIWEQERL